MGIYGEAIERAYGIDTDNPMRRPVPENFRRPRATEYVGFAYVCLTCGANVSPSATELHLEWHRAD